MRIVQFSSTDGGGGAGLGALRLHQGLRQIGEDSTLVVWRKVSNDPHVVSLFGPDLNSKMRYALSLGLSRLLEHYLHPVGIFSFEGLGASMRQLKSQVEGVDVIQLGWLGGFVDSARVAALAHASGAVVAWTLMDHAPLTGGCHYTWSCRRFAAKCGQCPALHSRRQGDFSAWALARKKRLLGRVDIGLIAASTSDAALARQSSVFHHAPLATIPIAVDPVHFRPVSQRSAREVLGLPFDTRVLFFGTALLSDERKGLGFLVEALKILSQDNGVAASELVLLLAGREVPALLNTLPYPVKHLGFLGDQRSLALAYQAADVYVSPVVEDSGPMMVLESLMCGTPVAAFEVGYAADLLTRYNIGTLAEPRDAAGLAAGLKQLLGLPAEQSVRMRQRCAAVALNYCSSHVVAKQYLEFYQKLVSKTGTGNP